MATRIAPTHRFRALAAALVSAAVVLIVPSAAGAFSPPQLVSGADAAAKAPSVAADGPSSRYAVWVRASDHHVAARRVTDDGTLGPLLDLSQEAAKSAALSAVAVADAGGNVTVVWARNEDQHVVAVRIPAGGGPGGVIDVSQTTVASSSQNNAGVDGAGQVHVVWRNGSDSHVMGRTLAPDGSLGTVTDVSVTDDQAALWGTAPAVAGDSAGNAFYVFHRNSDCHIILRQVSAGVVGPAIDVTLQPDKAVGDTSPSVAVAGSNVLVVWHRDGDIYDHSDDTVFYSVVSGGTTPGPLTQLSATGDVSMMGIGAAGGPDGAFGVTWQGRVGGGVWYRPVSAAGVAGAAEPLLASGSAADAAPAAAIGPTAGSTVAWTAGDGGVWVTSTTGTWSPPAAAVPKATLVKGSLRRSGRKVKFKLSCAVAACAGTARLTDKSGKRVWAKGRFALKAGETKRVSLKLSKQALKRLRRAGTLKGRLKLATDGGSPTSAPVKLRR